MGAQKMCWMERLRPRQHPPLSASRDASRPYPVNRAMVVADRSPKLRHLRHMGHAWKTG